MKVAEVESWLQEAFLSMVRIQMVKTLFTCKIDFLLDYPTSNSGD